MALGDIPPWISVGPQSFGNAASEGARLDLARQQADTEAAMNAVRLNLQKTQADRDFALQQEQHALDSEIKRTQLNIASQQAARRFAAQQQYTALVAGGMEPAQAMLRVGPALGINMVGAGQLARWGQPPPPPQSIDFGNGQGGVYYNHRYFPNKPAKPAWTDETVNGHLMQRNSETGELKPILHSGNDDGVLTAQEKARIKFLQDRIKTNSARDLTGDTPSIQAAIKADQDEIDRMTGGGDDNGTASPPAAPSGGTNTPPAASRFKIVAVQ